MSSARLGVSLPRTSPFPISPQSSGESPICSVASSQHEQSSLGSDDACMSFFESSPLLQQSLSQGDGGAVISSTSSTQQEQSSLEGEATSGVRSAISDKMAAIVVMRFEVIPQS